MFDEAMHALGRRPDGMPKYRRLTRQEQFLKVQELMSDGLTETEAKRMVGIGEYKSPFRPKQNSKNLKSLDWMPAVRAYKSSQQAEGARGC